MADFIKVVREVAKKKLLFLPHAVNQMSLPERMISADEVREVVFQGEIILQLIFPAQRNGKQILRQEK